MDLQQYLTENNLPDFLTSWEEVAELTGLSITDLPTGNNTPVQPTTPAALPMAPQPTQTNDLAAAIAAAINPLLQQQPATLDESKVIALIKQYAPVKTIEVKTETTAVKIDGAQHKDFTTVVKMMAAGINIYLYGPAGTGKTQMAENAAFALGKKFAFISVCAQSTKSDLLGFINAGGGYVSTHFRECYENGGAFLIDEIDNGNPNILTLLNSALANGQCAFPDAMVKKHADFICIAAANTFGTGANREYVGRNQLDAANLNRFVQFEINYDEDLEAKIYGPIAAKVQKIRHQLTGERVIISMRNIANTAKLIAAGFTENEALQLAVINTIPTNLQNRIK